MRIAFTHAYCWPEVRRGAERFTQSLGAALAGRGHKVTILSSGWDAGRSVLDGVTTVRIRRRFERQWDHDADFGHRLLPRLGLGRYDVVHSMGPRDAVASIRAARLHRRRLTVYTDLGLPGPEYWARIGANEARAAERVARDIDVYSCMSEFALGFLDRNYGRGDGVIVPGGVDTTSFQPAPARTEQPTLLFSGTLTDPGKGIATLLAALPLIAAVEPGVRLWLSGPGDPTPFLEAAPAEARARTDLLGVGESDRQHERYGQAWATCLPSIGDSFGMVLIESLACGTPIVVTTEGAPHELVTEGLTGELCGFEDVEGLASACIRTIALTRKGQATIEACRATASRFDWRSALAPLVEGIYRGERVRR